MSVSVLNAYLYFLPYLRLYQPLMLPRSLLSSGTDQSLMPLHFLSCPLFYQFSMPLHFMSFLWSYQSLMLPHSLFTALLHQFSMLPHFLFLFLSAKHYLHFAALDISLQSVIILIRQTNIRLLKGADECLVHVYSPCMS